VRRDHGPSANFALFAGGELRRGQVIGETDARAEAIKERPLPPQNVLATLDGVPGVGPARTLPDDQGRPTGWLEDRELFAMLSGTYGRIRHD
jgi:hypothetical protein